MFQPVDTKVSFPQLEQSILELWKQQQIVEKNLAAGDEPFVFFEGPPTANGRPGVHHAISRIFKDIIFRYRSMRGQHVIGARGGWDTHGLPVEIEVEKELGFSGKPDIERYGIAEFNARLQGKRLALHPGVGAHDRPDRLLARHARIPISPTTTAISSRLWWIFKPLWDQGLLFRDYKVTMHCPRCGTSLSDHEVSLGFEDDVDDPSVWVRFRAPARAATRSTSELAGAAFLAWTTTPWTLPANVALAVKPDAAYVLVPAPVHRRGERSARASG